MVKITNYGHACFEISCDGTTLLVDPFLTGNGQAAVTAEEVQPDYILVTHGHGDHVGDAAAIAKRTGASIITTVDVGEALFGDCPNLVPGNIGGTVQLPFGSVKFTEAIHGSGVPGALACGFLISIGGKKIWHMGDTALTKNFELYENEVDCLLVPIGDVFTMGPADALKAVRMVKPKLAIPMHYNTFPFIVQDPQKFAEDVTAAGLSAKVLAPGGSLEI